MIRKVYVADVIKEGKTVGYAWAVLWFWEGPLVAVRKMAEAADKNGLEIAQIRRLR